MFASTIAVGRRTKLISTVKRTRYVEFLIELLIEVFGELIIQLLLELGFRGLLGPFRADRPTNAVLAVIAYTCLGLVAGLVSLWIVPNHLIGSMALRYINVAVTPIVLGLFFEWLGRARQKRGKATWLLDRFLYGFSFALAMGLVRLNFAN